MRLLAIETATSWYSVAVAEDDRLLAELASTVPRGAPARPVGAETPAVPARGGQLLPMMDAALQKAGLSASLLDAVAVSLGPGSFTGVRVALATAKGLALGLGARLIGFSTLEVLAAGYSIQDVTICALLNAGRGDLYGAVFESRDGHVRRLTPDSLWTVENAAAAASEHGDVHFIGDGAARSHDRLVAAFQRPGRAEFSQEGLEAYPRASTVARLAWRQAAGLRESAGVEPQPIYLRRAEAEINWEKGLVKSPLAKVTR
jgi:tRNA threonylcarbamoyladenosine biosynthesis protein TsaB